MLEIRNYNIKSNIY